MVNETCSCLCPGTGFLQGHLTASPWTCYGMGNCLQHSGNNLECRLQVGKLQKSLCLLLLNLRWAVLTDQIQLDSLTVSHKVSCVLLVYSCESETQLMSFARWRCRPSIVQTPRLRWKLMMFLGRPEPAVLQGAVTLSLDTAIFSMYPGKMDMTGCWLTDTSRVQKQTTPLKPQMVDAPSHLHEHTKEKSNIYFIVWNIAIIHSKG